MGHWSFSIPSRRLKKRKSYWKILRRQCPESRVFQRTPRNMENPTRIRNGKMDPSKKTCRFYPQGKCTRGTGCPFLHDEGPQLPATSKTSPRPLPITMSKHTVTCLFFARGTCKMGADCTYSHENDTVPTPSSTAQASEGSDRHDHGPSDSRARVQCNFFAKGECVKGEKCPYAHSGDTGSTGAEIVRDEVRSYFSLHSVCLCLVGPDQD